MRIMEIMNCNNQTLMNMEQPSALALLAVSTPNAETDFELFAPNEQATRNETPEYTIISGLRMKTK
jgi:hypothetical protein